MAQVLYKGTPENVWKNELKELNNQAKITLKLEDGVDGNEVVIVHEKHDGTYEIIPTTYDKENNTITFVTTSFSNYAIASKTVTSVNNEENKDIINPKTGDNIKVSGILISISILGIIILTVIRKKRMC